MIDQMTTALQALVDELDERAQPLAGLRLREVEAVLWARSALQHDLDDEIALRAARLARAIRNNRGRRLAGLSIREAALLEELEKVLQHHNQEDSNGT